MKSYDIIYYTTTSIGGTFMNEYLQSVNAGYFYLLVAGVLAFITAICVLFLVKSYKAGIKIGMDKKVLKKTIMASASFTLPTLRMAWHSFFFRSRCCSFRGVRGNSIT